jgi:7,8-dihydropterin-6-yl-methyl-4-(beta-D-ribofuranosyl)aminobenzene 5'-phosphate synthase
MRVPVNEADRVEILTLQDNYIDLVAVDSTEMLKRAWPLKDGEIKNSILAEHGFSALVSIFVGETSHRILFDFGFSEHGAAFNVDALDVDLSGVEAMVLSHGHIDHLGGLRQLVERIGKKGIPLVLHPAAFRHPRYIRLTEQLKINLPAFARDKVQDMGITTVETKQPYALANGFLLFLGQIPRTTDFEKGMPNAYYEEGGEVKQDAIEDDSAIVANVKGKGLIILSGCAHSGIINTVKYAQKVTGIDQICAVMGGFHLTGPDYTAIIKPTTDALKELKPRYVVPTHCTGRNATMYIEKEMKDAFLLNMAGTKLIFAEE